MNDIVQILTAGGIEPLLLNQQSGTLLLDRWPQTDSKTYSHEGYSDNVRNVDSTNTYND